MKSIGFALLFFVLAAISSGSARAELLCSDLFFPAPPDLTAPPAPPARPLEQVENKKTYDLLASIRETPLEERGHVVEEINEEMLNDSDSLKRQIRKQMDLARPYRVRVAVVGAGQHSAIFRLALTAAGISTLVFEAGRTVSTGVFGDTGASFNTNSENHPDRESNVLFGSYFRVWDFSHDLFPAAEAFGQNALVAHAQAKGTILFESPAETIIDGDAWHIPRSENWPARFLIATGDGLQVFADELVISTGLGHSRLKTDQPDLLKFIDQQRKIPLGLGRSPGIQYLEDFNVLVARTYKAGQSALSLYEGLDGVIVGDGHGSDTVAEVFLGTAERVIYAGTDPLLVKAKSILWLHQRAKTQEILIRYVPKRYKKRLENVFARQDFSFDPARLKSIRKTIVNGVDKFEITTDTDNVYFKDFIVLPTGYRGVAAQFLSELTPDVRKISFEPVIGRILEKHQTTEIDTIIARLVRPENMPPSYRGPLVIGAAASVEGSLAMTPEQAGGETGENSINFLNKRTRSAAQWFLEQVKAVSQSNSGR